MRQVLLALIGLIMALQFPNLNGKADQQVVKALRDLQTYTNGLESRLASMERVAKADPPAPVIPATASPVLTPQVIGQLAQPQNAAVPRGLALPPTGSALSQDQALFMVVNSLTAPTTFALYQFWGNLGQWVQIPTSGGGGGGGVTSVGLTPPAENIFTVTGSPVTSSGNLGLVEVTQGRNTFWAGPPSGAAANPTFRALVGADFPLGAANGQNSLPSAPIVRDVSIGGEGALFGFLTASDPVIGSHINKVGAMFKACAFGVMNVGGSVSITFRLRTLAGNLELAQWRLSPGPIAYNSNSIWMIDADIFTTTAGVNGFLECHGKLYTSPVGGVGGIQDADMTTLDIHFVPITPIGPIDLTTQQIINWTAEVTFTSTGTISQRISQVVYLN